MLAATTPSQVTILKRRLNKLELLRLYIKMVIHAKNADFQELGQVSENGCVSVNLLTKLSQVGY